MHMQQPIAELLIPSTF